MLFLITVALSVVQFEVRDGDTAKQFFYYLGLLEREREKERERGSVCVFV